MTDQTRETIPERKLIGTCRECKHWRPVAEDWGYCESSDAQIDGMDDQHATFGCIHWEAK